MLQKLYIPAEHQNMSVAPQSTVLSIWTRLNSKYTSTQQTDFAVTMRELPHL